MTDAERLIIEATLMAGLLARLSSGTYPCYLTFGGNSWWPYFD